MSRRRCPAETADGRAPPKRCAAKATRRACARLSEVRRAVIRTNRGRPSGGGPAFPFPDKIQGMAVVRAGAAVLCAVSVLAACSGSGNDTGSGGGWRVSGAHIRVVSAASDCRTPAPVLDTFSSTPSPQPGCSPSVAADDGQPSASASPSAAPQQWDRVHVEDYRNATASQQWKPIYTTYTAPPGTGVYQPMVHATNQPMPTPYATATPTPLPTPTLLPTPERLEATTPPLVQPSGTP